MTNPYQTPEGQLTDDDQAYGEIKFFSPSSRINRLRYWAHGMLFVLAFYAVAGIGAALIPLVSMYVGGAVIGVAYVGLIVFSVIVMIQRLHDLNKSGWMSLLALIPLVNIYLIVLLIFFKGTPGRNDYGLQTPPNKTWHWVLALVVPIVMAIGIVAAIAIPAYKNFQDRAEAAQSSQSDDQYSSEYTDESAYPAEASDYAEDTSTVNDGIAEEIMPDENAEVIDEESAIMDEAESETLE